MRLYIVGQPIEDLELHLLSVRAKKISPKELFNNIANQNNVKAFTTYDVAKAYAHGLRQKADAYSHFPKGNLEDSKAFPVFTVEFDDRYDLGEEKQETLKYAEEKNGTTITKELSFPYYEVNAKDYQKIIRAEFSNQSQNVDLNIEKNISDEIIKKLSRVSYNDRIHFDNLKKEIDKQYQAGKTEEANKNLRQIDKLLTSYNTAMINISNLEMDDQLSDAAKKKGKAKILKQFSKEVGKYESHFMHYTAGQNVLRYALAFVGGLVGAAVLAAAGLGLGAVLGGAAGTVICPVFGNLAAAVTAGSVSGVAGAIQGFGMGAMVGIAAAEAIMAFISARLTFKGASKAITLFGNSEQKATKEFTNSLTASVKEEAYKKPVLSK